MANAQAARTRALSTGWVWILRDTDTLTDRFESRDGQWTVCVGSTGWTLDSLSEIRRLDTWTLGQPSLGQGPGPPAEMGCGNPLNVARGA